MLPVVRVMRGCFVNENTNKRSVIISIVIPSRRIISIGMFVGEITPTVPKTSNRLKRLEPIILPSAISYSLRMTARHEDAISGSDVPIAITVSPITRSLTPSACARRVALYTRSCEAERRQIMPRQSHKIALALECKPHELLMENPYIYYKFEENNAK